MAAVVERIWQRYGLPVFGFHPISHPHYQDVPWHSTNLDQFIAWVRGVAAFIGTDSAAIHLAAGFDVPTLAVFVSIDPMLRARDYPKCATPDLRNEWTNGLHASDDLVLRQEVRHIWQALLKRPHLPWPAHASE